MYLPSHFAETRIDEIHRVVRDHPLGALVVAGPQGLDANHLPFLLDAAPDGPARLLAHVARANPLWQEVEDGDAVLVIFRAQDAYVSPNWYPSKHETHRQVPTWNYQVMHAHGKIVIRHDDGFLRGVVGRLTRDHEARVGEPRPWRMGDAEPAYLQDQLRAIVGIEITVTRWEGKSKLSQNKDARDRAGAEQALTRLGQAALANAMRDAGEQ